MSPSWTSIAQLVEANNEADERFRAVQDEHRAALEALDEAKSAVETEAHERHTLQVRPCFQRWQTGVQLPAGMEDLCAAYDVA